MKYLVLSIDVEPDCSPTWHYSDPLTFEGVSVGIRERLQPLFARYGICPTYLLNNVVLEDDRSVDILRDLEGDFELGTHLHPEFIEPCKIHTSYAGVKAEGNQHMLPPAVEFEKMQSITERFRNCFGRPPRSFRAGRFSAGTNTIRCLKRLGYTVDTSVTPHLNWNDRTRPVAVDYSEAPEQPYFIDDHSLVAPASRNELLEVPVTLERVRRFFTPKTLWLRPSYVRLEQMVEIVRRYEKKYAAREHLVVNMMFHNVEVIPGKSPYTRSQTDVDSYLDFVASFLAHCKNRGFEGITLSELHDVFARNH